MTLFLISIVALVVGYLVYGRITERIFGADPARVTPAVELADGVDFVPMPTWKVFLVQFLNIAGMGPIFGAIMGIMFGPAAFLWIVFGTIFAGAVHDYVSAMMSMRSGGASLPELIGRELGPAVKAVMRVFCIVLLLLVASVFVVSPAGMIAGMMGDGTIWSSTLLWVSLIFVYYVLATLLPVDKVIGKFYPVFGFALLFMALGILAILLFGDVTIPDGISEGLYNRQAAGDAMPIFPMMFVSIACGAISGFHATQSPLMARCLTNERLGRPVFYGAMVAEGIVALIWAAAAIAFTGGYEQLADYMGSHKGGAGALVSDISIGWLGTLGGILAIFGVMAAPITSGDTALRSARLVAADIFKYDQKPIWKRLVVSVPIFAACAAVTVFAINPPQFAVVWRYFAWTNQTLAMFTLWAGTAYLRRNGKQYLITLVPAAFMTVVSVSFFLVAPASQGGLGIMDGAMTPYGIAIGAAIALVASAIFAKYKTR